MKKSYNRDARIYLPHYVAGEVYSFYLNFDTPITDPAFADFKLAIYKGATKVADNVGTLKKVDLGFGMYNIYCEFTFPVIEDGQYQFVIYDSVAGKEKCRSNWIMALSAAAASKNTAYMYYRHSENIYNFYYDELPLYVNKFRLALIKLTTNWETDRKQYRAASTKQYRNVRSYLSKLVTVETYYFDDEAHEAFAVAMEHDLINIDGLTYVPKETYTISNNPLSNITKGEIQMYENQVVPFQ